ncbi:MAG: hydantoinase B/oxoprolinase family protein [Alphaproteobacteria bacterium]|nr:hydantoinase B/oxoprolinase family protein [Alphaproteobacteria bacterium]MCB9927861.1 hydantoinase B/oxoprolinase family protein [Alphaproteobacteria bacterium]
MSAKQDPVLFELFKNAMHAIADEMALTVVRTTYSGVLRDNMDFATAFCDRDGHLVAQGLTLPGHLGSVPTALAAVLARYGDAIREGDVFCLNDPYEGGMHLPDLFVIKPLFHEGVHVAFACVSSHHVDTGGRVPGSNAADSTEIYQEGLRIPPCRLYDRGEPNDTLFRIIEKNVRAPTLYFGDLRAQLAACHTAETQFIALIDRYGRASVTDLMGQLIDYAERMARAAIREIPDGTVSFEDWIDDDGVDHGKPIRLFVTIEKRGDRFRCDWTGTAPQARAAINNTLSFTKAACYAAIRSVLQADIPTNEGFFRCIDVTAERGTVAWGELPAACAARGLTGFRMIDCLFGALAQLVPDRVFAASDGGNTGISVGGYDAERKPFIFVDFTCGTWGGRPWADGLDGNSNMFANMASQPVEVIEAENPLEILAYEFVTDRCGAGQYRGGAPYCREYRFTEAEGVLQIRADRQRFRPYGLYGGYPGEPSANIWDPAGEARTMPPKFTETVKRDEVFRHEVAGAGGWGDPLERDPDAVARDVRNDIISAQAALADYGVVLDGFTVDVTATEARRSRLREARGWKKAPTVLWEKPVVEMDS